MSRRTIPPNMGQGDSTPAPLDSVPGRSEVKASVRRGNQYVDTFRPEYVTAALELMAEGGGVYALSRQLRCSLATLHRWMERHPEFDIAVRMGMDMSRGWWEEIGRLNLHNRHFNVALYVVQMHNRFGWSRNAYDPSIASGNGLQLNLHSTTNNVRLDLGSMSKDDLVKLRDVVGRYQVTAGQPVAVEDGSNGQH